MTRAMQGRHELILGGQRSGKSRCAEARAAAWLAVPGHEATLVATAVAGDADMRERIDRHRADRARSLPGLQVREVPLELPQVLREHSHARRLLVVDCLTLWLTNLLMPPGGMPVDDATLAIHRDALCDALARAGGPVVLVSNEIGLGVVPMTREARRFVDELGRLHQAVAVACDAVTLMVAGIEVAVKRPAPPDGAAC
jgi:adenosylcobinamide kinase/adenosylcobinamide-phosphate guanylyltransferase